MKCDNCGKEETWIEMVGKEFICRKCIGKHKIMGLLLRTHINTFQYVLRQTKVQDYKELMALDRKTLEELVDFRKIGIKLDTTNVVELE